MNRRFNRTAPLLVLPWLLWLLVTACGKEESWIDAHTTEMPVVVYVQADKQADTRTPGDPGESPALPLPTYLYLFIVSPDEQIFYQCESGLTTDSWTLAQEITNNTALYKRTFTTNLPDYTGDDATSRIYAIASQQALPQFSSYTNKSIISSDSFAEEHLKKLQFDRVLETNKSVSLRDLYGGEANITDYNTKVPKATVTCYHVAGKVDIRWNIDHTALPDATVTKVELLDVPSLGYFFNDADLQIGRTLNSISSTTDITIDTNEGSNIYGREDVYSFQATVNKTITLKVRVTVNDGTNYSTIEREFKQENITEVEAAYCRIDINIKNISNTDSTESHR